MATPLLQQGTKKFAKRKTPKGAARRTAEDVPVDDPVDQPSDADIERERHIAELAAVANERIKESVQAREQAGIESEWIEADDLFQGHDAENRPESMYVRTKYEPVRQAPGGYLEGAKSTLIVNITKPKTKVITSRIKELLVPNNERPFSVEPTPVPDFHDQVAKNPELAGQNITVPVAGQPTLMPAGAAVDIMATLAREASKAELDWIDDRFIEGKVYSEMRGVIEDAVRLGTGVLKGPMPVCRKTRKWEKNKLTGLHELTISKKDQPTSKRVRCQDIFPDPMCGESVHNGNYLNERRLGVPIRELKAMADDPQYDAAAIAQALIEGPMTIDEIAERDPSRGGLARGDTRGTAKSFTLWFSYGDVPAETLIAMGVKDDKLGNMQPPADTALHEEADGSRTDALGDRKQMVSGAMPQDAGAEQGRKPRVGDYTAENRAPLSEMHRAALASVPAIVVMLNGRPIRASISPLESGEFPFDVFRYEEVAGRVWGRGVPIQMRASQLMVKSGVRRLMENGGTSSGPQAIFARGIITPMNGVYEITGRKAWWFEPNDIVKDVRQAVTFLNVPSMQKELMEIVKLAMEFADSLTNTPMLLHGDEQVGAAPETLGGLRMFENNAMSPLRDVAKAYDDDLIIPHLGRYHEWWMAHGEAENKGDSEVKALGSTALIKREEGRQFLMQLFPVKDDPSLKIDPTKYSKEVARAHGYDMSLIQYSDDEWKKVQDEKAKQQPPMAPQVQAAQIRAQAQGQTDHARAQAEELDRRHKAEQAQLDRQNAQALMAVEREIEVMRLSGQENISIAEIQAMLAKESQKNRLTRDELALKLNPQNVSHEGI